MYLCQAYSIKVLVVDQKLFTLKYIDECFTSLNIRLCDGDKPSPVAGVVLTATDSNLHQHGKINLFDGGVTIMSITAFSHSDVDNG